MILGSNLPAWLKKEQFEDPQFLRRTLASGVTVLRIPGGSWSDEYGWLSCEMGADQPGAYPCRFPWASRPTDFINFFRGIENLGRKIEPLYILNVNYTAQEAAAAVAFFNAEIGQTTPIGIDRNGVDWKTAAYWAALRAANGNEKPLGIKYWEIGNELYGGKAGGSGCGNGWEETWTCLGDEYILGTQNHDGFIAMREAMKKVDPDILVGAVGGTESLLGNSWSEAVIRSGIDHVDYLSLHTYPTYHIYGNHAKEYDEIFRLPQYHWPKMKDSADSALFYYADGKRIPLVVSEYELVPPWGIKDTRNYMNAHIDAIFLADSIGQIITAGFDMAMQWDLMNSKSDDYGNEFGLMQAGGSNRRQPKYYSFVLWSRFGNVLLPHTSSANPQSEVSVYTGRPSPGQVSILLINKTGAQVTTAINFDGTGKPFEAGVDVLTATSPDAFQSAFNGVPNPADDLSDAPSLTLKIDGTDQIEYELPPYAIALLRVRTKP